MLGDLKIDSTFLSSLAALIYLLAEYQSIGTNKSASIKNSGMIDAQIVNKTITLIKFYKVYCKLSGKF
jgi:hypothetical protein